MTLVIEDGTGKTDAQAYADAATVTTYHEARGNSTWTGEDEAKEAAILRAMTFLDALPWHGYAANAAQALAWPRSCMEDRNGRAIASNVVPSVVIHALAELALRELVSSGSTLPDVGRDDSMTVLKVAGTIEMEWATAAPTQTRITIVEKLLQKLIAPSGGARMVR